MDLIINREQSYTDALNLIPAQPIQVIFFLGEGIINQLIFSQTVQNKSI